MRIALISVIAITVMALFAYTGVQTSERELTTLTFTDNPLRLHGLMKYVATHHGDKEDILKKWKQYEYIHSVWVYTNDHKYMIHDGGEVNIGDVYNKDDTTWIREGLDLEPGTVIWSEPFGDAEISQLTLLPYIQPVTDGCVAIMIPLFYSK